MPAPTAPTSHTTGAVHNHTAGLETCLALVNTLELGDGASTDALPTSAAALGWLDDHGLGHAAPLAAQADREGDAWLARIHRVRAAIRATWDAIVDGRAPGADSLATMNDTLASAPIPELHAADGTVLVGHRHRDDDPAGEALARLVAPLVAAIAAGDTARFRVCANDGCRWVFEDTSRSGRRRWCDMTTCGNRAKVRRFRTRHRDGREADDPGNGADGPVG